MEAIVLICDDVGNPATWYFADDIYFVGPAAQDENQGTMKMDRQSFDAFKSLWIERMRAE